MRGFVPDWISRWILAGGGGRGGFRRLGGWCLGIDVRERGEAKIIEC
jgi:hypothetical protein